MPTRAQATDPSRTKADNGHETAGEGTFFAVTEEEVETAGSAKIANEDVFRAKASFEKLGAIGFAEIKEDFFRWRLVAGRGHVQPLKGVWFVLGTKLVEPLCGHGELGDEGGGDFTADLVAAAANRRAEGGKKVGGLAAVLHVHFPYGFSSDALDGTAPASVNGSHDAPFGIDQEDGNAVGSLDREKKAGAIGYRSVARQGGEALSGVRRGGIDDMDYIRVDLFVSDERRIACTESGLEASTILKDVRRGIPVSETEIQNALALEKTFPAEASAKAVDQPGEFGESGHTKNVKAM